MLLISPKTLKSYNAGYSLSQESILDIWNHCLDMHLETPHKHCVFMNSFSRPAGNEHLKCFEMNTGVLYGNEVIGFRYNLRMLSTLTHPTISLDLMSENDKFKVFSKCYGTNSKALTNEDIDGFWRCIELKVGGFHPSLFNWDRVYPEKKSLLTAKCRNATGLTDLDYSELCSKKIINAANLSYLLCIGRIAELNNGHCYFADRGIVTLMTKYKRGVVEPIVKRCIDLVLNKDVFDFKKYYHCIFNSNMFGEKCFV